MSAREVGVQEVEPAPAPAREATGGPALGPARALALQRAAGNRAVARLAARQRALQRQVRVDEGRTRVDEARYTTGAGKHIGIKRLVSGLINDGIRRVFLDATELEDYANGLTDHIGDVVTKNGDTFWFRLPKDKLTVLGEFHEHADGNVEDVIRGLRTSRFMYEPFNELARVAFDIPQAGTQARLAEVNKSIKVSSLADPSRFDPNLENIVIKALTGASVARNQFIAATPAQRADPQWKARASTSDYSFGERVALYLSMAIHIAADLAKFTFPPETFADSLYVWSGRDLKAAYLKHQKELDAFMAAKDADDLAGMYELTQAGGFANLTALKEFTLAFHEYGSRYIEQLGIDTKSKELEAHGSALARDPGAKLTTLSPVREAIMWQKIAAAKGYLLVGMGDAHRRALEPKLDAAGIPHERVDEALRRQRDEIKAKWAP